MTRIIPIEQCRNVGIIAHIDAGKTTTTERVLFYTGKTHRFGEVDAGTTVTDWMVQERERGITIVSAAVTVEWKNHQINIIDTPGHIDFTAEVQRSLRVLDGGVVIFDSVQGVESQSETVWRQADRYGVPRICFANKMDRIGASYERTIETIRRRLGANPIAMQVPIGSESDFVGAIDLLSMQAIYWDDEASKEERFAEIPESMLDEAKAARLQMIEKIVEFDDILMMKYLEGEEISIPELKAVLRKAVISNRATPIFCGTSLRNKGVQPMLDAIIDYLPSPLDIPPVEGLDPDHEKPLIRKAEDTEPACALVFKIVTDTYVGRLVYVRIYSGKLTTGEMIYNPAKSKKERVGRLLRMYADHREDVTELLAGDIGAVIGLRDSFTGDTLCDIHHPIILEKISFPEPVISVAIEPKTTADQDKMNDALRKLSEEDPTFRIRSDENTGQTVISGMGELHLDVLVDRMLREFRVQANVGKPRVSYRETITVPVKSVNYKYAKQSGGHGQYGHVIFSLEPLERGNGIVFEDRTSGGDIPKEYIPAIEKGVREATESGTLAGYPMMDIKVVLTGGSYHEVDSSEMAFRMAAILGFKEGIQKGSPVLLEPIMKTEVIIPEENLGDVLGQLSARRAVIGGMEAHPGNTQIVRAVAPLSEMSGYATELRSATKGRGVFTVEFDHYAPVPEAIAQKILH